MSTAEYPLDIPNVKVQYLKKRYDLGTPERLDDAITNLENWIFKQRHFIKKDFDRKYLENVLITSKGSIENAKTRIEKLCTLKTLLPEFFPTCDPEEHLALLQKLTGGILPNLDDNNYRIYLVKDRGCTYNAAQFRRWYMLSIVQGEYLSRHDSFDDYTLIFDVSETSLMDLAKGVNLFDLKNFVTILVKGYGLRIKGIHVLTAPTTMVKAIEFFVAIIKGALTEKIASRFHIHKSLNTLLEYVPKQYLTAEYGGPKHLTLDGVAQTWRHALCSKEQKEYFKEMSKATVYESFKTTEKFHKEHLGLPGSFRKFDID